MKPFTIESKKIKYLGGHLTKYEQNFSMEKHKEKTNPKKN